MASFSGLSGTSWLFASTGIALFLLLSSSASLIAQQQQGFALERFYPSAPGAGWFVMDDLRMDGSLGGAMEVTTGYSRKPLLVSAAGGPPISLVSDEAFTDIGAAVTHDRYRAYLNIPMPLLVTGNNGTIGSTSIPAPDLNPGTNPDTISDPRLGLDVRFLGTEESPIRLGGGAQLLFPSGQRSDYVTDARYRAMFRFLAAGDANDFSFAGQIGFHVRTLNDLQAIGGPDGSEFLFGGSVGRRFSSHGRWHLIAGPEVYGETALGTFFSGSTGVEALVTTRFETDGEGRRIRIKVGVGHGILEHFGAPEWRVLLSAEIFGEHRSRN